MISVVSYGYQIKQLAYLPIIKFVHANLGSFVYENGAERQFTEVQGYEWTGGETFDDLIS